MAEIKNTFIKSKMNKDLDDRLVPTGEYRDALNIQISRSEGDDVGALENALGNDYIFQEDGNYTCIGYFSDSNTQVIYYFVTNYIDSSVDKLSNFASLSAHCSIRAYDLKKNQKTVLVEGPFLNFSANKQITGVNVVEDLLFWTDNRNQPRKININTAFKFPARNAISGSGTSALNSNRYYTHEDQISVAKYYPWKPISLMNINDVAVGATPTDSTMSNPSQQYIPLDQPTVSGGITTYNNPDYDANFAGDPDYLSDKFIRLSYRFKFDDNEYSLMAPFTQPCFIPRQNGYFLYDGNDATDGDQQDAYRSTVVNFFENNVTQILANIEFESTTPDVDFKIKEVEILYKESDGLTVKVIEAVPINDVLANMAANGVSGNSRVFTYKYISTKPYKTLPENQLPRVYDQVPTRALSQEVAGNRVIYGNFTTKGSSLNSLDYNVLYGDKTSLLGVSQKEYPNHTLKQNRNYQVGFVFADRYGRQTGVMLSSNDTAVISGGLPFGGSTVYVPYKNGGTSIIDWPGYALRTVINSLIPTKSQAGIAGYPGIYKDSSASVDYLTLVGASTGTGYSVATNVPTTGGTGTGLTVDILTVFAGKIGSLIINNPGSGYTNGDEIIINQLGHGNDAVYTASVADPNPMGWYTYKVVVRQTEQDYYNVYLPGILNGYPRTYVNSEGVDGTTDPNVYLFEQGKTANIVLLNDNINKVPRDLNEVGPDQKQYRSAVRLFGRVAPVNYSNAAGVNYNKQYYPSVIGDSVISISTLADTNYNGTTLGDITEVDNTTAPGSPVSISTYSLEYPEFYQSNTNPSIARIDTKFAIGKSNVNPATGYLNTLAVYETDPVESRLDIYWETTTAGKIKDLNNAILDGGFEGAIASGGYTFVYEENDAPQTNCFNSKVYAINGFGNVIYDDISFTLIGVSDGNGVNVTNKFELITITPGTPSPTDPVGFNIRTKSGVYFYVGQEDEPITFNFVVKCENTVSGTDYTGTIVLNEDTQIDNSGPDFYVNGTCGSALLSTVYPTRTITLPNLKEPKNGDVLVYTLYAQNGSNCTGGLHLEEIVFELEEDGTKYIPGQGKYYIVPNEGDVEGNTNWASNPGVCKVYCRDGATAGNPTISNLVITAKDANGTRDTFSEWTLEQTVTFYAGPQVSIDPTNPVCVVGTYGSGTIIGLGDYYTNIKLRYAVEWTDLIIGNNIDVTFESNSNGQGAVWSNPGGACGVPGMPIGGGNYSTGSFNAAAATATYYVDVTFEEIYDFDTGNTIFDEENLIISSFDSTGQYTGNNPVVTFTGNPTLYAAVYALIQAGTPCPCIP